MTRRISRPHVLIGALALVCVLAVPLATSWGDPRATDSAGVSKKKFKKLKKRVKALEQEGQQPGPQGPPGARGEAGEDATNLFAYIRDSGSDPDTSNVQYGSGVTAVLDPAGSLPYEVTFNRSLRNCIVHAVPGEGDPGGIFPVTTVPSFPVVGLNGGDAATTHVIFRTDAGTVTDTSFLITAFC